MVEMFSYLVGKNMEGPGDASSVYVDGVEVEVGKLETFVITLFGQVR